MAIYTYPAVWVKQTDTGAPLVLFAAPATEISSWAGIPQKSNIGDNETVGFQRTDNPARIERLVEFYSNGANVVQNPLLCALRDKDQIHFEPEDAETDSAKLGHITIHSDDLDELPLVELIARVRTHLESRLPELRNMQVPQDKLELLRTRARSAGLLAQEAEEADIPADFESEEFGDDVDLKGSEESETETSTLLAEESHIQQFWEDLKGREQLLHELGLGIQLDEFVGYSRRDMEVYLRPAVLVDGQHRLLGAVRAAEFESSKPDQISRIAQAIESGIDPDDVQKQLEDELVRSLPVSLLMTDDPAEHVFQFVVVNQKATLIGRPLLGTIVSTSLSNRELAGVSDRLEQAGIPLEDSRGIDYMARQPVSPFFGLVRRGMNESGDRLDWLVLGSLINIFRRLKGGRLYHERVDYADLWRRRFLGRSAIVADYAAHGYSDPFEYWSSLDGPWREVFIRFWSRVRERLGDTRVQETGNYWGTPRSSNLFNKVTLTILSADFFAFLTEGGGSTVESVESVDERVDAWLEGVSPSYFARDWKLTGVKKDSPGIRRQWSFLWSNYRKDPQRTPSTKEFSKVKGD